MCTRTAANAWFRSRTLLLNHGLESWLPIAPSGFTWWSEPFALCGEQISGFENQKWLNCHNTSNTHGHTCEQLHAVRLSPFCSHTTLLEPSSTSPVPNRLPSHIAVRAYSSWAAAFLRSKDSRSPEVIPRSKDARSTEVILRSKDGRSAEVNPRSKDARSTDVRRPSSYTEQARQKWGSPAEQRRGLLLGTLLKTIKVDANLQAELFKKGHSRHDFSPMEISIALRTLCLDDIGRKTTPDWERALLTAKWYLEPTWKTSPFDHTVLNALWKILGEAGRADQIMALYKEAKKLRNKQFGAQIVVNVARALFAAGDHSGVVDVIEEARENGWQVELFDEVIQSQVKLGLLDDAFVSFDAAAARGQGTPVLTQTYVALLSAGIPLDRLRAGRNDCELARALGQLDRKHEAVGILRDTLHPMRGAQFFPIFLWLDAVVAAIEMGCFDAAEEFRERGARMKGFHFVPTLSFYVKNRHVLASHRVLMTLLKFDPEMNVAGIGPALISLLCSAQHANEAVEVLDALLKQGSVPFPKTFGKIIFCLLDEGRLPEAEAVLASFYQHVESQPDPQLYTTVFDAFVRRYLRVKQPERVLPLVKQARSYKQLIPLKSLYDWAQHLERHSREHAASFRKYIEDETSRAR